MPSPYPSFLSRTIAPLGFLLLLFGIIGGELRIGAVPSSALPFSYAFSTLAILHGYLMLGFFGTLISLESAAKEKRWWGYLAPTTAALGTFLLLLHLPFVPWVLLFSALVFLALRIQLLRLSFDLASLTLFGGAVFWLISQILLVLDTPGYHLVPFSITFLILTIAGERYELSGIAHYSKRRKTLYILATLAIAGGTILTLPLYRLGMKVVGIGLLILAYWLIRFDIAFRTVRIPGRTRFIAAALISGYLWLIAGGVLALIYGGVASGPLYSAITHALFLGFIFSMIIAHAPVIFPAVLGFPMRYTPWFYLPLLLIHLSVALRVISEITLNPRGRALGGAGNGIAILLFFLLVVLSVLLGRGKNL